jgi:putative DNA primase/helicase
MMPNKSSLLEVAAYIRRGWFPVPIPPRKKVPKLKNWQNLRLAENDIRAHFGRGENVGLLLGQASGGLIDIDLDATQALVVADTFLPMTARIHGRQTRRKSHHWYRCPDLHQPKKYTDVDGTSLIEIRTDGQQTLVPPSLHPSGELLRWECEGEPAIVDAKDLCFDIAQLAAVALLARHWPAHGSRHEASLALYGFLLGSNFIPEDVARFGSAVARAAGDEEWTSRSADAATTIRRLAIGKSVTGRSRLAELTGIRVVDLVSTWLGINSSGKTSLSSGLGHTDLSNAQRFVLAHGEDLRFSYAQGKWLTYDGRRWTEDDTGEVPRRAKETVKAILPEAAAQTDDQKRKKLVAWQTQSESENRLKALVSLAQSENGVPIRINDLDSDPQLFNCQNGTLDLRTGRLRGHRRQDMITKISLVGYDEDALCPEWLRFLDRIMGGNKKLLDYLRRIAGYSLTGDVTEQLLFLLYGTGANGKSTFLETLRYIWGGYAMSAGFSSFVASRTTHVRNDLARLVGARLVTAAESQFNQYLAEPVIKQITGGDTITARYLYSEYFEFRPQFKLFLATNHKPKIRGNDFAIWRRVHLIPFTVAIPADHQDRELSEKLRHEASGILRWAVQGLADWRVYGISPPTAVTQATSEYRSEEDVLQHFLDERCILECSAEAYASDLYSAYWTWCAGAGEAAMCKRDFGLALEEHGFQKTRNAASRKWNGLRLSGK